MDRISQSKERLAQRLTTLGQALVAHQVEAYLVSSSDAHLNEYVSAYQRRRAAISGFTGSAGDVLICPSQSHLMAAKAPC